MLVLKNIKKSFASNLMPTLAGINLEFKKGEFCILIGSNGCGKSTLLKCLSGEYSADEGSQIIVDGHDLSNADRSHLIAHVTQETHRGTVLELTLLENMVLSDMRTRSANLQFYAQKRQRIISRLKNLNMGLENFIDAPLSTLSGGQRQMIATMMAVSSTPQILLLDEHTSALDPKTQATLMKYTECTVRAEKITTLMITHRLDDAIKYGDRIIMMYQGEIVFNVAGDAKAELTVPQLLNEFHRYEDLMLTNGATP